MESDMNQLLKSTITFSENNLILVVYNCLCALASLHEANVMHRDIKPANILINSDCEVKICDFGFSRTISKCNMNHKGFNTLSIRDSMQFKYRS